MIGPHQSIICRLIGTGHGAAACMTTWRLDGVVALPHLLGEPQQAHEHRRHELGVGHAVPLDELRGTASGVEALHHHDGGAETVHGHRVDERRGVVERGGGEVHGDPGPPPNIADALARSAPARSSGRRTACPGAPCAPPWAGRSCPTSRASRGPRRSSDERTSAAAASDVVVALEAVEVAVRRRPGHPILRADRARPTIAAIAPDETSAVAPQSSRTYCTSPGRRWRLIAV